MEQKNKFLIYTLLFLSISFSLVNSADLFAGYYKKAEKILGNMTMEQKIGQMFFPRFNKATEDEDISTKYPGGYVLFAVDFRDKEDDEIISNINHIQNLSQEVMGLPLGLSVDEEGGTVNRISPYKRSERFPSPQEIYNSSGIEGILTIDKEKRELLSKYGMNINLAPVADISYNSSDYIYPRTLGRSPKETAQYIKKDVNGYVQANFSCCTKHFPGYGNNINTHTDVAYDTRPYEQFQKEDFLTFKESINEKIPMILVAHNIVLCKDKKYPASLSKTWHDILRKELGHTGLILTDDLSMEAIKKYSDNFSPAIIAVNAGNDILLTSDYNEHLSAVIEAVKNGTIKEETVFTAARRIIAWKLKYLLGETPDPIDDDEDDDNNTILIIVCCIAGGIGFLLIVGFFILCCFCNIDKGKKTEGSKSNSNSKSNNEDKLVERYTGEGN